MPASASKTDVWLVAGDGTLLGAARGPGSNHQFFGLDGAMDNLGSTVEAALAAAGRDPSARPAAPTGAYCLAGVDLPVDEERLGQAVRSRGWSSTDLVRNDRQKDAVRSSDQSKPGIACGAEAANDVDGSGSRIDSKDRAEIELTTLERYSIEVAVCAG